MTAVTLRQLTKQYGDVTAVAKLDLAIAAGELVALLGPSGCGKTTTLRMIAGLLEPTAGDVHFNHQSVLRVPAEKRGAVMVFQKHLLFPSMDVGQNVGFGLKMQGVAGREIAKRVGDMLDLVHLAGFEKRRAHELSGGQQQRVALARALVVRPNVLLLDEPLANLDANLRLEMRELIRRIQRELNMTLIFVTHDQEEAVMLADRVALLFAGTLQQYDQPVAFYERPRTVQIARFFRNDNFLPGIKRADRVETALGLFQIDQEKSNQPDGPVLLTVRPEAVQLNPVEGEPLLHLRVVASIYLGTHTQLQLQMADRIWQVHAPAHLRVQVGEEIGVRLPPEQIWLLPAEQDYHHFWGLAPSGKS
ncbi:MAG: ABC transporter ATP-binding protein [Chloroflexota bacterium]|nr:ABC transporter ATP-binding protein [Chloroflexota bacterium]